MLGNTPVNKYTWAAYLVSWAAINEPGEGGSVLGVGGGTIKENVIVWSVMLPHTLYSWLPQGLRLGTKAQKVRDGTGWDGTRMNTVMVWIWDERGDGKERKQRGTRMKQE